MARKKKLKPKNWRIINHRFKKLKTLRAFKNPKNLGPRKIIGPKNT